MRSESALSSAQGRSVPARRSVRRSELPPQEPVPSDAVRLIRTTAISEPHQEVAPGPGTDIDTVSTRPQPGTGDANNASSTSDKSASPTVAARSLPPAVPFARTLSPRSTRVPHIHQPPAPAPVPSQVPSPAPAVGAGVQRRASRTTADATIGASAAPQEDLSETPASAAASGTRNAPRPSVDTTRDQEWLMRHAQALYPLLRTMLRAELLRDHERRGHMLKENF